MKQIINDEVYFEIRNVLEIKKEVREKIPESVLRHIYRKASKVNNKIEYTVENDILNQISRDAFCVYISLYLQYVATENEKNEIKRILIKNEMKLKS